MDHLLRWMECALCLENRTEFSIYCPQGHSFCPACCKRLVVSCPICRADRLSSIFPKDESRRRIILECYTDFIEEIKSGGIVECDVRDRDNVWREGSIVQQDRGRVKIHFYGWESCWDEWHPYHIDRIRPHHSMIPDWFGALAVGTTIEYRAARYRSRIRWHEAIIQMIDPSRRFCWVRNKLTQSILKIKWSKHHIAPLHTHIPRKKNPVI